MQVEIEDYHNEFLKIRKQLESKLLKKDSMIIKTGINEKGSLTVFKLVKEHWTTTPHTELGNNGVFFGMWIETKDLKKMKLSYGVHQLKLKELTDYKIKPGDFVDEFRMKARDSLSHLPNFQIDIGPVYLYRGDLQVEPSDIKEKTAELIESFVEVGDIIDSLFATRRRI